MEMREMTCIACPMGCRMTASRDERGEVRVEGQTCKRGLTYGIQEFTCPMRTVTSSVRVSGGRRPLCAVKTQNVIPKAKIPEALEAIRMAKPTAPIRIGDVIIANIADTGVNLVATASVGV